MPKGTSSYLGLDLLDYFFVKLMPVFSLMPMLEPPFSATRYDSFFLFMLVLLLVFVTSFLAAYACFRRLCSSPRFLPLGMPGFLVYVRTYARFMTSYWLFIPVFVDYARDMARFRYFFTALPVLLSIFVFLSYFGKRTTAVYYCKAKMFICCRIMLGLMEICS